MKMQYRMMIVIVCIIGIIIFVDRTRETIIPVAHTPIQSLDERVSEEIAQQPDGVTSPEEDSIKDPIEDGPIKDEPIEDEHVEDRPIKDEPIEEIDASVVMSVQVDASGVDTSNSLEASASYDAIVNSARMQIVALQSSCQGAMLNVYFQYAGSEDVAEKNKLIGQGKAELARCDSRFDGIMSNLETILTMNNMPTTIIGTYRSEYIEQKALAQSILN